VAQPAGEPAAPRRSTAPAVLSALAGPGAGQIKNGRLAKGLAMIAATLALLIALAVRVAAATLAALEKEPDLEHFGPARVFDLAHRIRAENAGYVGGITFALAALWAFSIWDAWRETAPRRR
jgi:hypothetical protein